MQKLRRGGREDAQDWNTHLRDPDRYDECVVPKFPFQLTPVQQESMLSAHLWNHDLPSVWYGEGPLFELRRERYKRIKFYAATHRLMLSSDILYDTYADKSPADRPLRDLLDVVHRRRRDLHLHPLYEQWAKKAAGNKFTWHRMWDLKIYEHFCGDRTHQSEIQQAAKVQWTTAKSYNASNGTLVDVLRLEGLLGTGLAWPKVLVIPPQITVVDILATLTGPTSQPHENTENGNDAAADADAEDETDNT